ncbi:stage II sporulation protein AA (anti-sigma F factor antagonist) [Streptomyces sp. V3I8]|uniref:STAS domain-containing protein n=1 Tax=Streptomyces sp. V3I8 TaxID=3042279 RepID=UPI00278429AC|nr:STAS domain-containing protein [Streptomyces sp. V3I8]MDQ1033879.1 stage II sporulation protein AA (anti-sigma F factor antagonist) [Streptomyces sp. V3I8]
MTDIQNGSRPGRLSIEHSDIDSVRVVTVRGEIDHAVSGVLGQALLVEDHEPPRIVVDLSGVTFMDSSGINAFILAHQAASGARGWLRIAAAQEPVLRVLQLVGVDALIPCHPTVEQAVRG